MFRVLSRLPGMSTVPNDSPNVLTTALRTFSIAKEVLLILQKRSELPNCEMNIVAMGNPHEYSCY